MQIGGGDHNSSGPLRGTFIPACGTELFLSDEGAARLYVVPANGNEASAGKVRIALVTARNAPAHERVERTLRAWKTPADERPPSTT